MATKLKTQEAFLPDEVSFEAGGNEAQGLSGIWLILCLLVLLFIGAVGVVFAFI